MKNIAYRIIFFMHPSLLLILTTLLAYSGVLFEGNMLARAAQSALFLLFYGWPYCFFVLLARSRTGIFWFLTNFAAILCAVSTGLLIMVPIGVGAVGSASPLFLPVFISAAASTLVILGSAAGAVDDAGSRIGRIGLFLLFFYNIIGVWFLRRFALRSNERGHVPDLT